MRAAVAALVVAGLVCGAGVRSAFANGVVNGTMRQIVAFANGDAVIYVNGTISNKPACNTESRFAVDTTVAAGRSMLAVALAAHAIGSVVQIRGQGTCNIDYESEDADWVLTPP